MIKSLFGGSSTNSQNTSDGSGSGSGSGKKGELQQSFDPSSSNSNSISKPSTSALNPTSNSTISRNRMKSLSKSSTDLSRLVKVNGIRSGDEKGNGNQSNPNPKPNPSSSNDDSNYLSYHEAAANKSQSLSISDHSTGVGGMPSPSNAQFNHHSISISSPSSSSSSPPSNSGLVASLKSRGKRAMQRLESTNNHSNPEPQHHNHPGYASSPHSARAAGVVRRGSTGSNLLLSTASNPSEQKQEWPDESRDSRTVRTAAKRSHPPTSYSSTWRNRSHSRGEDVAPPLVILGASQGVTPKSRSRTSTDNQRQGLSESPTSTFPASILSSERSEQGSQLPARGLVSPSSSSTLSPSTSTSGVSTAPSGTNSFSTSNTTTASSSKLGIPPASVDLFNPNSRLSQGDHPNPVRPLSSVSFTSENDSLSHSSENLERSGKRRFEDGGEFPSASHKSSFSTLKGKFGTLTRSNNLSSTQQQRSHTAPLPPPSSYPFSDSNLTGSSSLDPDRNQQPKSILSPPTRSLAEQLNELAVANGDGLLSDEEYRLLRASLFERLDKGEKEIPVESAIKGGGMERGGRVMGRDDVFTKDAMLLRAQHSHGDLLAGSSNRSMKASGGGGGGQASSFRDGNSTRSHRSSISNMTSLFRRATTKNSKSSEIGDDYKGVSRPPSSYNAPPTSPGRRPSTTGSIGPNNHQTLSRTVGSSLASSGDRDSFSGNGKTPSFTSSFSKFKANQSSKIKAENMERTISSARSARSLQAAASSSSGNPGLGNGSGRSQSALGVSTTSSLLLSSANGMLPDPTLNYNGDQPTSDELKAEIAIVEAEGKRLIESFNGLEQVSIGKYQLDFDQLKRAYSFDKGKNLSMISTEINQREIDRDHQRLNEKEEKRLNRKSSTLGFGFGRKRTSGETSNKEKEGLNKLFLNPPPSSFKGTTGSNPTSPAAKSFSSISPPTSASASSFNSHFSLLDDPRFSSPNRNLNNNLNEEEVELQIEQLSLELKEIFQRKQDLIKRYDERLGLLKSKLRSASIKETVRNR